jgi:DNA-binding LacI/PurR family transcriptional regulator
MRFDGRTILVSGLDALRVVRMPTMADVAKRAGVAVSTVSYALSGVRPVAEATRQRIMAAIAELDYHPNLLARGLAGQRTRIIALLFPSVIRGLSQVQLEFVNAAVQVASQHGYAFLLWTSPSEDGEILRLTKEGLVEGLLLMEIRLHDPRVEMLKALGYPFCMIGHTADNAGISFVDFDFDAAARLSIHHLYDLGHRDIACFIYSPYAIELGYGPAVRTSQGIAAACEGLGLSPVVRICEANIEATYQAASEVLQHYPSVTAAVFNSDLQSSGILQAIRQRHLHIPEDFSVVAITSSRFADLIASPLTVVDLPAAEMGRIATELLIRLLRDQEHQPSQILLAPELIVRSSSGPCRARDSGHNQRMR